MKPELTVINNDDPTPSFSKMLSSTKLVMPENLNPAGNLFGGQLMAWMDKVSAMLAFRVAKGNVVTVSVDEINFKAPAKVGDQIEIDAIVTKIGNSSMQIYVDAHKISVESTGIKKTVIADSMFTFVHLDEDGKPCTIKR